MPDTTEMIDALVDRFLSWPLPASVAADPCATDPNYPHPRSGTNLLTATEAREMLRYVLSAAPQSAPVQTQTVDLDAEHWKIIQQAAEESKWIPPEYYVNDWVSDVCDFLRNGRSVDRDAVLEEAARLVESFIPPVPMRPTIEELEKIDK